MQHYDLIIVGGGLVGTGLAVALRDAGMRIALIDARTPSHDDPRLFGLNIGSCNFLKNLGVWEDLSQHAFAIHEVHVSSKGHFGSVRLTNDDIHLPSLGYVIPAKWLELTLNAKLQSQTHCTLYQPATVLSLDLQPNKSVLTVKQDQAEISLSAPIVIGADGTSSTIREQCHINADIHDYQQTAIVTKLTLKRPHLHTAHERFVTQGAIALLPLNHEECACIWSAATTHADELMSLSEANYVHALQTHFGTRAGKFIRITKRHQFPLRMVKAETAVKDGVYLLGNAAHTFHPIAAQGFNLAMYEVAVLVEAILKKRELHEPFTSKDLLTVYEQTQKQQSVSLRISHGLSDGLFGSTFFQGIALPIGLTGLNILTPIKKHFLNRMLGRSGRVPRLLLSEIT